MTALCSRCRGCGQIADSESGEPWTDWESLPPGSDLAVRLGIVKPIPCPECSTRWTAAGAPAVVIFHSEVLFSTFTEKRDVTPDEVRRELDRIRATSDDFEAAHGLEDELHQMVLQSIAEGSCREPEECARLALSSLEIDFERHGA